MAEFPLLKMINIDGRQTPFVYPQHKTLDGYKETGEENPLPTASYGMTDSGVWIPQKVSNDGALDARLTGSISEENISDKFEDIPAGTTHSEYIKVPDGYNAFSIWVRPHEGEIKGIRMAPGIGSIAWSRFREELEVFADFTMPSYVVITKKKEVPTNVFRLELRASEQGDVVWGSSGGQGIRIFWHKI